MHPCRVLGRRCLPNDRGPPTDQIECFICWAQRGLNLRQCWDDSPFRTRPGRTGDGWLLAVYAAVCIYYFIYSQPCCGGKDRITKEDYFVLASAVLVLQDILLSPVRLRL